MDRSSEILIKYFKRVYEKVGLPWTDQDDLEMELLGAILRSEPKPLGVGDEVILDETPDGDTNAYKR